MTNPLQQFLQQEREAFAKEFIEYTDGGVYVRYSNDGEDIDDWIPQHDKRLIRNVLEIVEETIQKERYAGAPYALNEVAKALTAALNPEQKV